MNMFGTRIMTVVVVLTITLAGAYYFIWGKTPQLVEDWNKYFVPEMAEQCQQDELRLANGGIQRQDRPKFCQCFAEKALVGATVEEYNYQQENHTPSPNLLAIFNLAFEECRLSIDVPL